MSTHALLGLKASLIRDEDGQAQSISITEPQDDSEINLTLIFNLEDGSLVTAEAARIELPEGILINDGNEG